jgi:hypothetical protein
MLTTFLKQDMTMYLPIPTDKRSQEFIAELEHGQLDTAKLRSLLPTFFKYGWNNYSFGDVLAIDVLNCSVCGLPCFAAKTISGYNDAYWICELCKDSYSFCKECRTYVLTNDINNPSHDHINTFKGVGIMNPGEGEKAVWNADIMTSKKAMYYLKTPEEQNIAKHRKENRQQENFRYFGVELEVEKIVGGPPDILLRVYKQLGENFVLVKHDGSLSDKGKGGFEIVSVPATIKYHKSGVWDGFFNNLSSFFQEQPPTTGLHVHIDLKSVGKLTAGKMLLFVNSAKNREFIERVAQRVLSKENPNGKIYAGVKEDWKVSDVLSKKQHEPNCPWDPMNRSIYNRYTMKNGKTLTDTKGNPIIANLEGTSLTVRKVCTCMPGVYKLQKYEAFNLMTKRETVELRIFRGIVSQFFLYVALEFADALADFCNDTSPAKLSYRDFLNWMTKFNPCGRGELYPSLSRHLINEGWLDPPKAALESGGTASA